MTPWITCSLVTTAVATLLLVLCTGLQWRPGVYIFKPIAATGFLATALLGDAMSTDYGRAVMVALCLCWMGDVLLIPRSEKIFRLGIVSFLLGHLGFVAAFIIWGVDPLWSLFGALGTAVAALIVLRWLLPHLGADMKTSVIAYIGVISVMMAVAIGTYGTGQGGFVLLGAAGFFASDLAVARQRFVTASFINGMWGTPLYFGAQTVLALTVSPELLGQ